MASSRMRKTASLATKTAELAVAVPQVVAHRVTRMALSGPKLSERDRKEFKLMNAEKVAAFIDSWNAMTIQAMRANQAFATSFFLSLWAPFLQRRSSAASMAAQMQNAMLGVLGKGLAPVHRKAVANAKRLARTRLR